MRSIGGAPSVHELNTWEALVAEIKLHLSSSNHKNIQYGDLSERIFGARNKGAATFRWSLDDIYNRINEYNRINKATIPHLNALVFNQNGKQPGIPKRTDPKEIWSFLEKREPDYLKRLGILLGYHSFSEEASRTAKRGGSKSDSEG